VVSTTLEDIEDSWIIQQDLWRFEHKNDRIIRDTSISNMSKLATCYFDLDCLHSGYGHCFYDGTRGKKEDSLTKRI
jgi:hypothetical protein